MRSELGLVVFDLAGTTVKDDGHVAAAFTAALAKQGVDITTDQLASVRGASKREAVLRFIPDGADRAQRADAAYAAFRGHLAEAYRSNGAQPIAGAEALFGELRARGVRVALNTGFDRDTTELLLNALRWREHVVDAVVCSDDVRRGRPAPYLIFRAMEATGVGSVHAVANVGDTALDLHAGYNAGVRWNIGVLSGAHDRSHLERAPHTQLIASVADLPALAALHLR
jgi:phosphonatase-like hydrolase